MGSPGGGRLAKVVTIGVDAQGNPTCDPMDIDIWSTLGDTINWASSGIVFLITFPLSSPFSLSSFYGPNASSGPIRAGVAGSFKYSVDVNGKILDPKVGVRPP
jgi:hypothetical protein